MRYAETAGHEFDYDIPNAFRYRDYLIRAFNLDVPYDQFVIEHISGDALESRAGTRSRDSTSRDWRPGFYAGRRHSFAGRYPRRADAANRQPDRRLFEDVSGADIGLRPLSRSQIRPDHHQGLLRPGRISRAARGISRPLLTHPIASGSLARHPQVKKKIAAIMADASDQLPNTRRQAAGSVGLERAGHRANQDSPARADRERVFEDFNRDQFDGWFVTGDAFGERPTRGGDLQFDRDGNSAGWLRSRRAWHTAAWFQTGCKESCARGRSRSNRATFTFWTAGKGGRISVVIDGFEKIRSPIYGGLTTVVNHRPVAAMGDAERRDVAGSFRLSRNRRRCGCRLWRSDIARRRRPRLDRGG